MAAKPTGTDRFMQGILVRDDVELFSYTYRKHDHTLNSVVRRLKKLKKNLTSFKYVTQHSKARNNNSQAVFSKTAVHGNVDAAISDVWDRLRIKHDPSEE